MKSQRGSSNVATVGIVVLVAAFLLVPLTIYPFRGGPQESGAEIQIKIPDIQLPDTEKR